MARRLTEAQLFPGWRMSPDFTERRFFQCRADVPPGWFREGDADDPRRNGGGASPAAEAPVVPPAVPALPASGMAVPEKRGRGRPRKVPA